jgi:hypothetical protein
VTRRCAGIGLFAVAAAIPACDPGQGPSTGLAEPMMTTGQFIPGDLPGTPFVPVPDDAAPPDAGADAPVVLTVISVNDNTSLIQPGANGQSLGGTVSGDSTAVGMRLEGLGTGYWVVPVGAPPDLSNPAVISFGTSAGFSPTISPGNHNILFVAIGSSGQGGEQYPVPFCFEPLIPDNGHICNPAKALPAAVMTLQWDANFDLDLHVVTPGGDNISPENIYGMVVDAGPRGADPNIPHIDRDSLHNCVPDGFRQEDVIFLQPPERGTYTIYVDPYASCGQAATRFVFTLNEPTGNCATCELAQVGPAVSGEVLASQVTGGVLPPLRIDELVVH